MVDLEYWRKPESYPNHLSDDAWRWEFMRRHPHYRSAYNESSQRVFVYHGNDIHAVDHAGETDPATYRKHAEEMLKLNRQIDPTCKLLECRNIIDCESVYGVNYLLDWQIEEIPETLTRFWCAPAGGVTFQHRKANHRVTGFETPIQLAKIDLRFDISDQLKKTELQLIQLQKSQGWAAGKGRRRNTYVWPKYLQAIDARAHGATYAQIGKELTRSITDPERAGRQLLRSARSVQNLLTFMSGKPPI